MKTLTSRHEVQAVGIHSQAGDGVQVGHHGVDQLTCTDEEEEGQPIGGRSLMYPPTPPPPGPVAAEQQ